MRIRSAYEANFPTSHDPYAYKEERNELLRQVEPGMLENPYFTVEKLEHIADKAKQGYFEEFQKFSDFCNRCKREHATADPTPWEREFTTIATNVSRARKNYLIYALTLEKKRLAGEAKRRNIPEKRKRAI